MTIFNCAQGHQWTVADQSSDTVVCPYCGGMGSARAIKRSAIPDRIGSYRVIEALGHGGMGVVYKARQLGLDRFVAIKMLITGRYSDAGAIGRVRQEAEAISRLQHANIVQIHEIGEHEGQPFLVLEYVVGSDLGQLRGKPLPSTVAARLVQALSRAIAHAHRRGIVHRDIKPANVLLAWPDQESAPQLDGNLTSFQIFDDVIPKISDFGLAKRLDINSGQTLIGTILGTPSYMAPEQAAARMDEVGPASDIYSLGAVLYELVTGRPPFRAETALATLEQVTEDDPVPPRQLQPGVARDLETICLKCLEKDPAKRYVTADDLAADLGRYLNQEPIVARRQNLFVYVSKWVRRRPAAAALIFVSVLALLTLIIGSQWYSSLVRKERNLAEANFSMALNAVDEMLTQVGDEKLAYEPRMEEKRQALLQNALGFYKRFLHERQGDRRLQIETAYAYRRMADVEKLLGNYDAAQSAYLEAIRLFKVLQGKRSVAEYRRWEAYCWNYLGESQRLSSRPQEAFTSYTNALKLQQKLTQEFPELLDYQLELARTHYNVGILWRETNRLQRSEKELREALPILQALVKKDGKRGDFRFELSRVHTNVGSVMRDTNRATLAIEEFTEAISLLAKLVAEHPENTDFRHELAVAHTNRGNAYHISNQIDEARADYEVARQDLSSLTLDYPRVPSFAQEISNTENSLAAMLHKAEGFAAAEKVWLDASTRLRKLTEGKNALPTHRADLGMTLGNLGWLYLQHQDLEKACDYLREGIGHLEQALSLNPIHPVYSRSLLDQYVNLADASLKLGDYVTAADVASKLKTAAGVTSADKYAAACFLIRSGAAESADERLKADEREQHAKRHFQEARALVDNLLQDDFHDLVPLDEQAQEGIRMGLELDAKLKKAYEELLAKAQH